MSELFTNNPLLVLFLVAAIGYAVGNIKIRGTSLGVSAVLFFGLFFGGLFPGIELPNIIFLLGLTVFVYTIGLSNGKAFFKNIKRNGIRDLVFIIAMLTLSGALTAAVHYLFGFKSSLSAGLFAGSTTNTPALAGLLDTISKKADAATASVMQQDAVIGYSLSYPMGVLGVMIAIAIMTKWLGIDFKKEARSLSRDYPTGQDLESVSIKIQKLGEGGISIRELLKTNKWKVVFGRIQKGDSVFLPNWDTIIENDNILTFAGRAEVLAEVVKSLGSVTSKDLSDDSSAYQTSRIFVSNAKITGKTIASLNLGEKFSAIITRVRRGDIDVLADGHTVLELGDRIRFVARKEDLPEMRKLFGDSYDAVSHINLFSFGLGMALGILLGMITFTLTPTVSFKLGFAGGPLIVGLILGSLRRTGPIVWTLPYSANLTLRQFSLILLLATIGVQSGSTFFTTIGGGGGGMIFIAGTIISCLTAFITLWIGYKWVKIPFSFLLGMVSNQPAILQFSMDKSGNQLPSHGYTIMFPIALIIKIVYVQLLFTFLQ